MSTSKATKRLNFSVQPDGPIARLESIVGDDKLPDTITNMLNCYFGLLHRATPKFADRELCAIFDALGEHYNADPHHIQHLPREISAAISTDRLDAKWSVDAEQLRNRLDRTSFPDRLSIAEMSAAYWCLASEDEFPQATIKRIKDLIQPAPTTAGYQRPRRISPDLFEAGSLDNPAAEPPESNIANSGTNPDNPESSLNGDDSDSSAQNPELPLDPHPEQNTAPT